MQILHVSCVAPPTGGGIGKVADREVRELRAHGAEAWLACPKVQNRSDMEHIIEFPAVSFGNANYLRGIKKAVQEADIVHLHYPYYGTAENLAYFKSKGLIKKLVLTLHMDAVADGLRGMVFNIHRRYIQPKILRQADLAFVSSLDYAENSSFKDFAEAHREKIIELPFGVETDCFCPGNPARAKFDIPPGSFVIGTVSVQDEAHRFKGIDLLIKAMTSLPESAHLLLVGEGDLQQNYKALANQLGVNDRVHFVGRLSQEDLICAYRSMDVFAFPSTSGAEAFGLAMLEAMSCGVPVVASNLPGVRKVAESSGLLIQPNDVQNLTQSLNKLIEDPELCRRFAESARAKALKYNWQNHAHALISNYQKICA